MSEFEIVYEQVVFQVDYDNDGPSFSMVLNYNFAEVPSGGPGGGDITLPIDISDVDGLPEALDDKADADDVTSALAAKADTTAVNSALSLKANSADLGTAAAATVGTNSSHLPTVDTVNTLIQAIVGAAPEALDTLVEIAAELEDQGDALGALILTVSGKLAKSSNLSDLTDVSVARDNLELGTAAMADASGFLGTDATASDIGYDHAPTSSTTQEDFNSVVFQGLQDLSQYIGTLTERAIMVSVNAFPLDPVVDTEALEVEIVVPDLVDNHNLIGAHASLHTSSSSGPVTVQVLRRRGEADPMVELLSTPITVDEDLVSSYTSSVPAVVDGDYQTLAEGDRLRVRVEDTGTGATGLIVILKVKP